jgi:peptidoglycan/LPS O-acetylase OafA/YrhL
MSRLHKLNALQKAVSYVDDARTPSWHFAGVYVSQRQEIIRMKILSPHAYRPDIDGLRAIAVLAVIAFHLNANILPGGFVGVDIFFVISGYLITGIIAKGIEEDRFRFAEFYTRRIKRIFPAYIVVALFTLAISSYLLIPNDYIFYTTSLAASWAFTSNIFFSMLSWGYFGQRTEEFPLLHTWSLSVEEQFYFVFPILLIVLYRYFRKYLIPVLMLLAAVFVAISQLKLGQVKSYFLLTSRAHELAIGALTFFVSRKFPLGSTKIAAAGTAAGIAAMMASAVFITRGTEFPGINSLYPCLGAALVIYCGQVDNRVRPLLSNKLMVFIGLISYSLYLWHWPIFSFLRYRRIDIDLDVGIAAVASSFVLAMLTWKFIEVPIRRIPGLKFRKAFFQIYLPPAALCMAVGAYSYLTEGAPNRFSKETRELIASYSFARDLTRSCSIRAEDYRKITFDYLQENCAFGAQGQARPQILLIGDSHADHFKPFVDELAKNANLKAVFHVQGLCPPTDLAEFQKGAAEEPSTCAKRNADLLDIAGKFKYVVLGGFWADDAKDSNLALALNPVVERILKAGAIPVIFKDNAFYEPDMSKCILHRTRGWIPPETNCHIPYSFVAQSQGPYDAIIDKVKTSHPELIVIDPKQVMCNSSECLTYISNTALYKDSNHINTTAAKLLAEQYIARVGNPLLERGQERVGNAVVSSGARVAE